MEKIFQLWLNDCFHQFNSHIALEYGTEQKTYLDLQRQSNYIGNWIVHQGIPKETFIGIYTPNRTRLIESIIGILYAGCVFVPLDPAHPDSRLETMIEKAEIKWVLCDSPQTHPLCQSPFLQNLGVTFISFDAIFDPSASGSDPRWFLEPPPVTYTPEDKIYIYFTSGTTGTPKAIIGKNKSLFHFIEWEIETFSIPQGFRISQWTTPGFDAFLRDVFVALCSGGTSCIPPADDTLLNADKLIEWTDRQHINLIHCVPSIFRGLNSNTLTADHFSSLKYIMLSGEKVTPSMLEHWYHIFGDRIQLVNYYGPSETTMIKTFYLIQPEDLARERIPVGKPMKGCRVAILDDEMKICDERITGEIYIRTPYRTHGYYKEDDLNREKFIANPLNNDPNDIVFRTGDLGRFLPDGSIEFLGRKDRQVKIRGVRVELEEIEMTLLSHPLVAEAAVIKKESGNNELVCAYITQKPGETMGSDTLIDRLTDYLKTKLPPYMIPNPIRVLDHIQKKPNGKIDYDSLPDPIRDEAVTLVPPQNEVQRKLARIWTEILGIDSIGITHNFFQLGGNSLNVISLISFIQRDFDIKPTLAEIFQHDTIEKQEALLRTAGLDPFASIEPAPIKEYYAVSSVQRRLFFLQFFDAHNMSYNMPQVFTLEGEYNREKIEEVFRKLIERHESLRTSFHVIDEEAKQKIHDDVAFHIEFVDLSSQTAPDAQTEAIITSFIRPFDLSQAPLFRVGIIVLNPTRSVFMIDTHHIVSDGVSQGIFNREFLALYQGEELPPLRIQYKDVAEWLNSDDQVQRSRQQEAYWLNRFEGELPLLTLPADVERPATQTFEGSEVVFELGESLTTSLKSYAIREDVTLYMALLALFNLVLSRLSGQEDIIVGTSLAGRRHADLEGIIGMFVNALALRNYPHGHQSFRDFLREVKQNTLEAFENQDYPFENLVEKVLEERVPGRNPLFDVMMVLNNEEYPEIRIAGLKLGAYPYHRQSAQMDLKFRMVEIGGDLSCTLEYSTGLFNEETIRRLANYFKTAVSAVLSDPSQTLSAIDLLPEDEKQKLLVDFNNVETDYPVDRPIHRFFEDQVRRTPDRIAVVDPSGATLTYDALNRKANGLARLLQKNGVGKESVVGIMMEPSIDMIAGLLAILKAGGAYLPIDVGVPAHRALFMLENAQSTALLTHGPALTHSTISFTALQNFESKQDVSIIKTPPRSHIQAFDSLPMPDRSLIDLSRYPDKIGMASVTPCMSLQATRGCPYECLFCHKVWSKKHVFRSAENIFNEVNYYYKRGVRHFAIIDDCFNLNRENSTRFFKLVIQNKLAIRLFFPNGLRGDLLTPDDIDLMVEAGTRGINLSLETASPRLQKLIKKNLDIDKFKKVMDVIATRHPEVILEIATMHGFPTETEDEALMTLDFIKSIRWIHFPYIHILKIYPNTEMEALALEHGVSKEDIMASKDLAFHQLPETLPFSKSFTREYQSDFMNNYFLSRERLKQVMPVQLRVMGQQAMVQKYDTYLPIEIQSIQDVIDFAKLDDVHLPVEDEDDKPIPEAFQQKADYPSESEYPASAKKILLLDLSQHFSSRNMLYNVVEQPLGLISLLTYIRQEFGDRIVGRIYKSGVDFDSYEELHALLESYHPDVIGIRTLTLFKEFFHETVSFLRQWGITAPIIAGGPYATSDYDTILKDRNIDLVVFGEGEYTFKELLQRMFETDSTDFKLPSHEVLQTICGIAYAKPQPVLMRSRAVLPVDDLAPIIAQQDDGNCDLELTGRNLAYVMYTSGSTGIPKGVMVEHRHANNCIWWMDDTFGLKETDAVVQRTNLSFDPSVWEIFWPLYRGAAIKLLTTYQRKDAEFLANLMANPGDAVMMYCPATLVSAITYYLDSKTDKPTLTLPWLIIGAEPISMETVKHFYHYYKGTIVNTYGPTECAINNTYYRLDPDDSRPIVPIGRPVTNNRLYILSPDLQPMAMNAVGEIHIAGNGVVRGYLNNPQLTSDKFLTPPPTNHPQTKSFWKSRNLFSKRFLAAGGSTLYQTGDLGRWLEDGVIEIMGRIDEQVKIRGHRIELGEIETALSSHNAIKKCMVIAGDNKKSQQDIQYCKKCGIGSHYPGVRINDDGCCEICESVSKYKRFFDLYFKKPEDLQQAIRDINDRVDPAERGAYDCLLLYSGGRGSAYALYRLADMGFKVLTATYDNGYFSKKDLENIKRITDSVNADHVILTSANSDRILKESIETAHTVCRGCFHTSGALAAAYAYHHHIPVVVGATLSRGQIIENKLFMFAGQGITDIRQLEDEVMKVQRSAPDIDKTIFDLIGIDIVSDRSVYQNVSTLDFYRYTDISKKDMIEYLNNRDPYWKTRKNTAIYSTNCPIKQIGDFGHLKGAGFHYYGGATSWEKRLGHLTMENLREDLQCHVTPAGFQNFVKRIDAVPKELEQRDEKYLAAYYVSDQELEPSDIRSYLSGKVPSYMVPSYFVPLKDIPLTVSGKVDRKKLPVPQFRISGSTYVKPETETQEILARVWADVLGASAERIGLDDNFFELGGDSIKAIQVTARLQRYKLKLDISRLFLNPNIRDLSGYIGTIDRDIPQGPVEGEVPLTPIQRRFFDHQVIDAHHYNQSVMLFSQNGLNVDWVEQALNGVIHHHDALRMVFHHIRQYNKGIPTDSNPVSISVPVYDLRGQSDAQASIRDICGRLQASIDLSTGPLLKSALFKTSEGDYLAMVIHHLVVDGVSWRILLEDLETGYLQAQNGIEIRFQEKTDSFKYWSEQLSAYAQTDHARHELKYWASVDDAVQRVAALPADGNHGNIDSHLRCQGDMHLVSMELNEDLTGKLLKEAHKAFNTEINDLLLTGLALAVREWTADDRVCIGLEGHGREPIIPDINLSRTVGWFTTWFPVVFDIRQCQNLSDTIKDVKETLRRIPNKGIGYGILRYLTPADKKENRTLNAEPQILFNYLGQFERENDAANRLFGFSPEPVGNDRSLRIHVPEALTINGAVTNGTLTFSFGYSAAEFRKESIEALIETFKAELERIINRCVGAETVERTASDFDATDLDQDELADIYEELADD